MLTIKSGLSLLPILIGAIVPSLCTATSVACSQQPSAMDTAPALAARCATSTGADTNEDSRLVVGTLGLADWESYVSAGIKRRAMSPGGGTGLTAAEKNEAIKWLVYDALSN